MQIVSRPLCDIRVSTVLQERETCAGIGVWM